jgi:hypothetical protein
MLYEKEQLGALDWTGSSLNRAQRSANLATKSGALAPTLLSRSAEKRIGTKYQPQLLALPVLQPFSTVNIGRFIEIKL